MKIRAVAISVAIREPSLGAYFAVTFENPPKRQCLSYAFHRSIANKISGGF